MRQSDLREFSSTDSDDERTRCPTCGRDDFASWHGMNQHHHQIHGESLGKRATVTCETCDRTFNVVQSRVGRARFCSSACKDAWQSDAYRGDAHPLADRRTSKVCEQCGDEFTVPQCESHRRFCEWSCYNTYYSETYHGSAHALYRGGSGVTDAVRKSLGPRGWDAISATAREHADHTCEMCGATPDRALDVHHIIPVLAGGTNAPWNLLATCQSCHQRAEAHATRVVGIEHVCLPESVRVRD